MPDHFAVRWRRDDSRIDFFLLVFEWRLTAGLLPLIRGVRLIIRLWRAVCMPDYFVVGWRRDSSRLGHDSDSVRGGLTVSVVVVVESQVRWMIRPVKQDR